MSTGRQLDGEKLRAESRTRMLWGLTSVLWVWFAWLMLVPYTPSDEARKATCDAPLVKAFDREPDRWRNPGACAAYRTWPELLGVLALATTSTTAAMAAHVHRSFVVRLGARGEAR
ncbi:hypothetical protein [Streptomyces sp. JJ38]|uniref:hypothetical protein n=1 Tax=Streptomyces sp. JJ38 TaxID=2738128 RepID=UPI001C57BAA4|nr:hypothetical protein [Streptomyces sp. JJ38]MBW1597361.1 hypothetical protein [Streptomyces sp. JJ38]